MKIICDKMNSNNGSSVRLQAYLKKTRIIKIMKIKCIIRNFRLCDLYYETEIIVSQ